MPQEGMALIFAMMAIIVIAASLALVMGRVQSVKRDTDAALDMIRLEEAAQAGVELAVKSLWNDYLKTSGSTTNQNWASYKFYLNNTLGVPINEDLNFNGQQDSNETGNGDGVFQKLPTGYDKRGKSLLSAPFPLKDAAGNQYGTIDSIHVARYDTVFEAVLTVRSQATVNGRTKTAVQVLQVGGSELVHTQFAILANNISCILCHAEFMSLNMEMNTNPSNYGTYDRIKIAALESMLVRMSEADSRVAGTVYTRGTLYKEDWTQYSASELASSTFKGYQISNTNGKILQNSSGAKTIVALNNATTNSSGDLNQFANLYRNYPKQPEKQTDGPLPEYFPAPFPDDNKNRLVDDNEFNQIVNTASGSITLTYGQPQQGNTIKAGVAYGVPAGQVYTGTNLPTTSNSAKTDLESTGAYNGNLILVGTVDDPIQINGSVAVNGDLVIKGPVKGDGKLHVRGNTYIIGDVTYADAPGEFGKNTSGTENAFALVSGGSILMGDYLTIRGVNVSSQNTAKYPNWQQYSIHARDVTRTNTVSGETLKWGYKDQWSIDPGQTVSGKPGQQFSFTTSELQLFNNLELERALANPNYTPRFYGLRSSQPNNIYVYYGEGSFANNEHSVRYSESGVKTVSAYMLSKGYTTAQVNALMAKAKIHYLNPKSNWLSETALQNMWHDDEMSRPSSFRDFKFDGLLYSNNAIFAIARSYTRHYSNTNGRMTIRGGVIASDLGIFVPGPGTGRGLNLYYDPRVERFLQNKDTEQVQFTRSSFYYDQNTTAS
jgi:hypothetical protein